MLTRLLETPLIDILLILLVLRLFFPVLFGVKSKTKQQAEKERIVIRDASSGGNQKPEQKEGKYIDYEEIK
jgi:hypothetical protein